MVALNVKIEDLREILKVFTSKYDLPKIVTRLSREAGQAMWQAMMHADGTVYSTGREMKRPCQIPRAVDRSTWPRLAQRSGRSRPAASVRARR